MTRARRAAGAWGGAALVALALSACGGGEEGLSGSSDGQEIEAVAERFDQAVAARDAEAFCETLSPLEVQRLGGGKSDGKKECLAVWSRRRNPFFKTKGDPDLTVAKITKIENPVATARLNNGGRLAFSREGGVWYVSVAPGAEQ